MLVSTERTRLRSSSLIACMVGNMHSCLTSHMQSAVCRLQAFTSHIMLGCYNASLFLFHLHMCSAILMRQVHFMLARCMPLHLPAYLVHL